MNSFPLPSRLLLFSPHPDDIAISAGAFVAKAVSLGVRVTMLLATDGSEARIPEGFLADHGWTPDSAPAMARDLRGRIRVSEAVEEGARLGIGAADVVLLKHQQWFRKHRTPAEFLHDDLSLRDVAAFAPGPITKAAITEIRSHIGKTNDALCLVPAPGDRLSMHRIVTDLVRQAAPDHQLLAYECLSTLDTQRLTTAFPFDEALMSRKAHAIRAHQSMLARREAFGGYSNPGSEFYDTIVRRHNANVARQLNLDAPFAERFGWL